jgi:hypothetical protein
VYFWVNMCMCVCVCVCVCVCDLLAFESAFFPTRFRLKQNAQEDFAAVLKRLETTMRAYHDSHVSVLACCAWGKMC